VNPRSAWLALAVVAWLPAAGQNVTGVAFEDRNGNGIRDAGEPALAGVVTGLLGTRDAAGAFDQTTATSATGAFSFAPGHGCYVVSVDDPAGWRMSQAREDLVVEGTPGYSFPVGLPRFAKLDHGVGNLRSGALRYTAMGDSIAYNFNVCGYPEVFWYAKRMRDRLACARPTAAVTLDQAAVKGEHTDDLLVDDTNDLNNVFRVIPLQPDFVTISMIGNDLLGVDPSGTPTQAQVNRAVAEVLDSRQNLQEALSALVSEIPDADIALNSLYDNLAYNCNTGNTSTFHRTWLPIVNRVLRDLAWGLARRVSINEAAPEYSQEDQTGVCTGYDAMICRDLFGFDNIHPTNDGYKVMLEKVWEAAGGVNLGAKDATSRTSIAADYGFLKRVRRLFPSTFETRNGAAIQNAAQAYSDQDAGAAAVIGLGIATEEVRFSGFPDFYDEDRIVRAVAGVRYRTVGTVADDFYRMEASVTGQFRPPPGHAYTPTDWNYYTPIVGAGGPNQPAENPDYPSAKLLARPNVASYREVSATLSKNPVLPAGAASYAWPAVGQTDLATAALRVAAAPVAGTPGNDAYEVELDAGWIDLYGWQKPRPGEVAGLGVSKVAGGTIEIAFEALAGAQRYNLYFGRLDGLRAGGYDHGAGAPAGPYCDAPTADATGGRLKVSVAPAQQPGTDSYFLVTAHVDDVESPAGFRSGAIEIDRSRSVCR
jgi:lysophospholipase L1-like esterase